MKLTVHPRQNKTQGELNQLRRGGNIPVALYGDGKNEGGMIAQAELQAVFRKAPAGELAITQFELHVEGKKRSAIIKEIQYHPVTYSVLHIDFLLVSDNVPVVVNVPLQLINGTECIGVKQGGRLRQILRTIKVECLPRDIPRFLQVDVKDLGITQSKRLKELSIPPKLKPLSRLEEVMVVVAKL